MSQRNFHHIRVAAPGVTVSTTASTSAGGAIPNNSAGVLPRFIRVVSTGTCYFRTRGAATTATNADMMLTAGMPQILAVQSDTQYAVIDDGATVKFNITSLEDS